MGRLSPEEENDQRANAEAAVWALEAARQTSFRICFPDYSLRWIFQRAAEFDPNAPTALQKDFSATIKDGVISVYAPYLTADGTQVVIQGRARAGQRGLLTSEEFTVTPEEATREEVDFVQFLKLTLREAFPNLVPRTLWLRDDKLHMLFDRL